MRIVSTQTTGAASLRSSAYGGRPFRVRGTTKRCAECGRMIQAGLLAVAARGSNGIRRFRHVQCPEAQ